MGEGGAYLRMRVGSEDAHYGTIAATYFPGHKGEDHASVAQPLYLS